MHGTMGAIVDNGAHGVKEEEDSPPAKKVILYSCQTLLYNDDIPEIRLIGLIPTVLFFRRAE